MADSNSEKIAHVNYSGHTVVDVNALLRDPGVRETIDRLSKDHERLRGKPGVTFIRPVRYRD
jgi:hypothetical protein